MEKVGDEVMGFARGSMTVIGLEPCLSLIIFADRQRARTSRLAWSNLEYGALASEEIDEIEDDREVPDVSETIDSGEDAVDTELASDDRRVL